MYPEIPVVPKQPKPPGLAMWCVLNLAPANCGEGVRTSTAGPSAPSPIDLIEGGPDPLLPLKAPDESCLRPRIPDYCNTLRHSQQATSSQ